MTLEQEIRALRDLRDEKDRTKRAADKARMAYDIAHLALWERMDSTGVGSVKIDGTLYSQNKPKVYGTVADKEEFRRWAVDEGNAPELFEFDPRDALVNEFVRLRIDNGEPLPPGVNFYTKQTVSQRKS
jgi:hypothetical protein